MSFDIITGPANQKLIRVITIVVGDDVEEGSSCAVSGGTNSVNMAYLIFVHLPEDYVWFATTCDVVGSSCIEGRREKERKRERE